MKFTKKFMLIILLVLLILVSGCSHLDILNQWSYSFNNLYIHLNGKTQDGVIAVTRLNETNCSQQNYDTCFGIKNELFEKYLLNNFEKLNGTIKGIDAIILNDNFMMDIIHIGIVYSDNTPDKLKRQLLERLKQILTNQWYSQRVEYVRMKKIRILNQWMMI